MCMVAGKVNRARGAKTIARASGLAAQAQMVDHAKPTNTAEGSITRQDPHWVLSHLGEDAAHAETVVCKVAKQTLKHVYAPNHQKGKDGDGKSNKCSSGSLRCGVSCRWEDRCADLGGAREASHPPCVLHHIFVV